MSSLSAINTAELPYHSLYKNSRPPTPDPFFYPLVFENQILKHFRQDVGCHIHPVKRINNSLQISAIIRSRELIRLTHTSTEQKFELTAEFIGLRPHPIPTSTQIKRRFFSNPFVVTI